MGWGMRKTGRGIVGEEKNESTREGTRKGRERRRTTERKGEGMRGSEGQGGCYSSGDRTPTLIEVLTVFSVPLRFGGDGGRGLVLLQVLVVGDLKRSNQTIYRKVVKYPWFNTTVCFPNFEETDKV